MGALYNVVSFLLAGGSRLNRFNKVIAASLESSTKLEKLALAKQKDTSLLKSQSLAFNFVSLLRDQLSELHLMKLQRFAMSEGMHHISSMFGSGHEPNPSVVEKDPYGILLVRNAWISGCACLTAIHYLSA